MNKKDENKVSKISYLIFLVILVLTILFNIVSCFYEFYRSEYNTNIIINIWRYNEEFIVLYLAAVIFLLLAVWFGIVMKKMSKINGKCNKLNILLLFKAIILSIVSFWLLYSLGDGIVEFCYGNFEIVEETVVIIIFLFSFILFGLTYWINRKYKEIKLTYVFPILLIYVCAIALVCFLFLESYNLKMYDFFDFLLFIYILIVTLGEIYLIKKLKNAGKLWENIPVICFFILLMLMNIIILIKVL